MADGAMFCSACGQAFSGAASPALPRSSQAIAAAPRVEYGGFWLRFLAYLIDGAVIMLGIFVLAIPFMFLTCLGSLLMLLHLVVCLIDVVLCVIIVVCF